MNYVKHRADESVEDYLETILLLEKKIGLVRSIDIANELNFTKPSVSIAMKNLREKEYVMVAENGYISLTESGRQRAESVLERHNILTQWLSSIGVSEETARIDACRIEHDLSDETFEAIKRAITNNQI